MSDSDSLKVLLAVNHFPPRYNAGSEKQALRIASALKQRGHSIRVVCVEHFNQEQADGSVTSTLESYKGLDVHRMTYNSKFPRFPMREEFDNQAIADHISELLHLHMPDIYHQIGGYLLTGAPILRANQLGIPTILMLMDYWFLCPRIQMLKSNGRLSAAPTNLVECLRCLKEEKRRFRIPGQLFPEVAESWWRRQSLELAVLNARNEFCLEVLNQTTLLLSNSEFLKNMYIRAGSNGKRILTFRQGTNAKGADADDRRWSRHGLLRVGYIGQISPHKGVHDLIQAVRFLQGSPVQLHIFGDFKQDPAYYHELGRLKLGDKRIVFEGSFRGDDALAEIMNGLDVLVVPSTWYENSPNVILEAFAYNTPVIASNLGGMAELVKHEVNGLLFEPGDPSSLSDQLRRLIEEPRLLDRLGAGIEPVRTVREEMENLIQLYKAISASESEPALGI